MSDRLEVDVDELRAHASNLMSIHERFAAVKSASDTIAQADDAYGQLCQFLPPVLEGRHQAQDECVDALAENIELLAEAVNDCAETYEEADAVAGEDFSTLESEL